MYTCNNAIRLTLAKAAQCEVHTTTRHARECEAGTVAVLELVRGHVGSRRGSAGRAGASRACADIRHVVGVQGEVCALEWSVSSIAAALFWGQIQEMSRVLVECVGRCRRTVPRELRREGREKEAGEG